MPLAGHESWWTIDAIVVAWRSLVHESWMPWAGMHQLREATINIVSTLRFT